MSGPVVPKTPSRASTMLSAYDRYARAARTAWLDMELSHYPERMVYRLRLSADLRTQDHQLIYRVEQGWDEVSLARLARPSEWIEQVDELVMRFAKGLPESLAGNYPHIRLWADMNLQSSGKPKLFGKPNTEIPGWVFGDWQSRTNRRYDGLTPLPGMNIEGNSLPDNMVQNPDPNAPKIPIHQLDPSKKKIPLTDEEVEGIMAATKKKRVVKTTPPKIDPSKIKSPLCPVHHEKMSFDPVKYKWKCSAPGCKITSRPVRDEDDKSVQIGKGETSLRIVATDDEFAVLLVSDDNLALNITKLIPNIKVFLDSIGAIDLARTAEDQGITSVNDRTPRPVQFELRFGILGLTELISKYESNEF